MSNVPKLEKTTTVNVPGGKIRTQHWLFPDGRKSTKSVRIPNEKRKPRE